METLSLIITCATDKMREIDMCLYRKVAIIPRQPSVDTEPQVS